MLHTFPNVCKLDGWFASVAPDYLAGPSEPFLVVCEGDEVLKRDDCAAWWESDVRRDSGQGFFWFVVRACCFGESVAVPEHHGNVLRLNVVNEENVAVGDRRRPDQKRRFDL